MTRMLSWPTPNIDVTIVTSPGPSPAGASTEWKVPSGLRRTTSELPASKIAALPSPSRMPLQMRANV